MISMEPDFLDQLYEIHTQPMEVGIGKDLKYSTGFSFYGSLLTMKSVARAHGRYLHWGRDSNPTPRTNCYSPMSL